MRVLRLIAATILCVAAPAAGRADDTEPAWRVSALALVPAGHVAGAAYRTDGSIGYLAVYPSTSNDPKSPASLFAVRQELTVTLAPDGKRAVSAELKPRTEPGPDDDDIASAKLHADLAAKSATLPGGTEPCDLGAWSIDKDPNGLNVRAEPSVKARVIGTLPPPYRLKLGGSENTPDGGWLTEFRIIGFRDGWFLIEGAKPPGKDYEDETKYPRNAPKPYAGRGWVAANKVGAAYANGGTRMGGLFQAPFVDARWMPAQRELGGPIDTDGGPKRLLACSGFWGLVESQDGVRGWWRGLCSNQVTNCS
ncbi:SH3 domain-containing protein [Bradyrhizobium hipponense]|uniref:SH3 domain-containing protein n=1 Tax=Bradyrhizobium hipponense TaxID=2605638 RepID=A0A5S4YJZ4_9BRAD|nr:SH3 domain-containing protein [Bradyrhizobium hipponense]TYO63934.1 SH3 domain-containing protein [Bradyrhizobium hipponense]